MLLTGVLSPTIFPIICQSIFGIIKINSKNFKSPEHIFARNYSKINLEEFNAEIATFSDVDISNLSIDDQFLKFQTHIQNCIDKFAPLRKLTRKESLFKLKPWITKGIQIPIRKKNILLLYSKGMHNLVRRRLISLWH